MTPLPLRILTAQILALLAVLWCAGIALVGYVCAGALFRRRTNG